MPRIESIIEPNEDIIDLQNRTVKEIADLLPDIEIQKIGVMSVPMIGRPELDLVVITDDPENVVKKLEQASYRAGPFVQGIHFMKKYIDGIDIALQIMKPENKMIDSHQRFLTLLKGDQQLKSKYEEFKRTLNGLKSEEYKKRKNEWIEENIKSFL